MWMGRWSNKRSASTGEFIGKVSTKRVKLGITELNYLFKRRETITYTHFFSTVDAYTSAVLGRRVQ